MAQEPGVTFDEGSPSDKEYALPLFDARSIARGGAQPGDSGSSATFSAKTGGPGPPLFGAGITRARQGGGDSSGGATSGGATGRVKSKDGAGTGGAGRTTEAFAASGSRQLVTGGLIGLAGLLVAGVAALLVRLHRSS